MDVAVGDADAGEFAGLEVLAGGDDDEAVDVGGVAGGARQRAFFVDLVNQHVDSIRAIVRERAKDEQNRVGAALTQTLLDVTEAYLARHGHVEEDDDGVIIRDL